MRYSTLTHRVCSLSWVCRRQPRRELPRFIVTCVAFDSACYDALMEAYFFRCAVSAVHEVSTSHFSYTSTQVSSPATQHAARSGSRPQPSNSIASCFPSPPSPSDLLVIKMCHSVGRCQFLSALVSTVWEEYFCRLSAALCADLRLSAEPVCNVQNEYVSLCRQ